MSFERKQFTFYRSFWDAMQQLSPRNREKLALYIIEYALNETEPTLKNSTLAAVFATIRPILDKARIKAMSGKTGGEASGETRSKIEAKSKQNEANAKQGGEREGERDREIDRGGVREQGQLLPPETTTEGFPEVLMTLLVCGIELSDQERPDCERLTAEYGKQAILEAVDRAREANVPRWSYIRKIVTTGGVRPGGAGASRRVRETNAQCQVHNQPPPPDSVMGRAIQEMLAEDFGEEEDNK